MITKSVCIKIQHPFSQRIQSTCICFRTNPTINIISTCGVAEKTRTGHQLLHLVLNLQKRKVVTTEAMVRCCLCKQSSITVCMKHFSLCPGQLLYHYFVSLFYLQPVCTLYCSLPSILLVTTRCATRWCRPMTHVTYILKDYKSCEKKIIYISKQNW